MLILTLDLVFSYCRAKALQECKTSRVRKELWCLLNTSYLHGHKRGKTYCLHLAKALHSLLVGL